MKKANYTDLTESETEDFLKHIDRKIMWKDQTRKDDDNLFHGTIISPLRTISSSHFWIKRNFLSIGDYEYIYLSGANLILHNEKDDSQQIITLQNDCFVTSIYYQYNSRGERIVILGEKTRPPVCEIDNPNYPFKYSGRVEIINLDKNTKEERRLLDHSYYVNYDSFIYDAIVPTETDFCITILKNIDLCESETKVFMWDFVNRSMINIQEFQHHIENICSNIRNTDQFIFYALYYCALWEFHHPSKKFILKHTYVNDFREVSDAGFVYTDFFKGVAVSYRSHRIEIFNQNHEMVRNYTLSDVYHNISRNLSMIRENFGGVNKSNSGLIIEVNESEESENNFVKDLQNYTQNTFDSHSQSHTVTKLNEKSVESIEFIKDSPMFHHLDMNHVLSNCKIDAKNTIRYIICRDKYIFVFFFNTSIFFVLEFSEGKDKLVPNIKLNSIDALSHKVIENTCIVINMNMSKLTLINGEISKSLFKSKFDQTRKSMFIQMKEKKGTGKNEGYNFSSKGKDNDVVKHKSEKVRMEYYVYNISFINSIPKFEFNRQILPHTGTGQEVKNLAISVNPRFILTGYSKKQFNFYQQNNIDEINSNKKMSAISFDLHNFSNYTNSNSHFQHYLQKLSTVDLISTKIFENQPISITISPYANNFFITFEETSYLYAIIDKEVRELAKINSYCQAAAYSGTGRYLAFANTEYKSEYNIIIINVHTFEVEYIITKLPLPSKIVWLDNDTKLIVMFQDTSTNILGWSLGDNRFIVYNTKDSLKNEKNDDLINTSSGLIFKVTDYTEKIVDFAYDHVMDYLVICSEERRVKIFQAGVDDVYWEFPIDCKYSSVLLLRKLDTIIFGTSEGTLRICLWPISNFTGKEQIDHPAYSEKFLHLDKVTLLLASNDLQFLYSASIDGSIYISSIQAICNDSQVSLSSFNYFDSKNILPKKQFMNYSDFIYLTDGVYKTKLENIEQRQTDIQTIKSEFLSDMDKITGENAKELEDKRANMNKEIEHKRQAVKDLEDDKETLSKKLKERRENQVRVFREEIGKIKNKYKVDKDQLQVQTKNLASIIKDSKLNFSSVVTNLEAKRDSDNEKIKSTLENLLRLLKDKYSQIEKMIEGKKQNFNSEINKVEDKFETKIRDQDFSVRNEKNFHVSKKKEIESEISKTKKDNQNYNDKIKEWEAHLQELKNNNTDLMESFLFNTLKLKQMNNLLKDNEKKISENEMEVKKQRTVNDRLEQLRYVLEYQIKNLIKEKTPIEEQIKNFEELHNDFYKRFNLLYAEKLNIEEFIANNNQLIETFKDQLNKNKKNLYNLKNLFRAIDLEIHFIFKNKIDDKSDIINKLVDVYNKYLKDYVDDENSAANTSAESKLQSKIIEKEINKQKNKILKDLINKRQDRKDINSEKEDLMLSIRLENQQLIEECSSIRMNLEDILKYITDIEKKFIELTNTHLFLHKNQNTKLIREDIKNAKQSIMLADTEKIKIAKGGVREGSLSDVNLNIPSPKSPKILKPINVPSNNNSVIPVPNINIIKKLEENKEEMNTQNAQIEKMQKKIRDLIGSELNAKMKQIPQISERVNTQNSQMSNGKGNNKSVNTLPVTGLNNDKLKNSRMLTIKSKYYDGNSGKIKEVVNTNELYTCKKK